MSRKNDPESRTSESDENATPGSRREPSALTDDGPANADVDDAGPGSPTDDTRFSRREALRAGFLGIGGATAGCTRLTPSVSPPETGIPAQSDNRSDGNGTTDPATDSPQNGNEPPDTSEMDLVLEDRFGDGELDTSTWRDKYPWGDRTHNYNGYAASENAYVEDDRLVLKAEDKPTKDRKYTTGVVSATEVFAPGYFEASIKIPPTVQGFWPAYWLTSASYYPPEIDIFEFFGADPEAYMTYHFLDSNGEKRKVAETWGGPPFSKDFHTFSVDWDPPEKIAWYIDGVERFRYDGDHVSDEYCHLILNFGIDRPGDPSPRSADLPATYEVDWIRCWER